jgi:hypothetical protein
VAREDLNQRGPFDKLRERDRPFDKLRERDRPFDKLREQVRPGLRGG